MDAMESEEPRLSMLRALPLMHRLLRLIFVGERERFTKRSFTSSSRSIISRR